MKKEWILKYEDLSTENGQLFGNHLKLRNKHKETQLECKQKIMQIQSMQGHMDALEAQNKKLLEDMSGGTTKIENLERDLMTTKEVMKSVEAMKEDMRERLTTEMKQVKVSSKAQQSQMDMCYEDMRS